MHDYSYIQLQDKRVNMFILHVELLPVPASERVGTSRKVGSSIMNEGEVHKTKLPVSGDRTVKVACEKLRPPRRPSTVPLARRDQSRSGNSSGEISHQQSEPGVVEIGLETASKWYRLTFEVVDSLKRPSPLAAHASQSSRQPLVDNEKLHSIRLFEERGSELRFELRVTPVLLTLSDQQRQQDLRVSKTISERAHTSHARDDPDEARNRKAQAMRANHHNIPRRRLKGDGSNRSNEAEMTYRILNSNEKGHSTRFDKSIDKFWSGVRTKLAPRKATNRLQKAPPSSHWLTQGTKKIVERNHQEDRNYRRSRPPSPESDSGSSRRYTSQTSSQPSSRGASEASTRESSRDPDPTPRRGSQGERNRKRGPRVIFSGPDERPGHRDHWWHILPERERGCLRKRLHIF